MHLRVSRETSRAKRDDDDNDDDNDYNNDNDNDDVCRLQSLLFHTTSRIEPAIRATKDLIIRGV